MKLEGTEIMKFNVTATTNIDSVSFHKTEKHYDHDKDVNHSNKDIVFSKTHYNQKIIALDEQETLRDIYKPDVERANKKAVETGHDERVINSVDDYINSKKTKNGGRILTTFSNMDDWNNLKKYIFDNADETINDSLDPSSKYSERLKTERRLMKAMNQAFSAYGKGFNDRNDNKLLWVQGKTNLDEKGAPHIHGQILTNGHTKKGKVSPNNTAGIAEEFGYDYNTVRKDPKQRKKMMKEFRHQEDTALLDAVQTSLNKNFPEMKIELSLKRSRLGGQGESMAVVKERAKQQEKIDKVRAVANRQRTAIMRANYNRSKVLNELKDEQEKTKQAKQDRRQAELETKQAIANRDYELKETRRQQQDIFDKYAVEKREQGHTEFNYAYRHDLNKLKTGQDILKYDQKKLDRQKEQVQKDRNEVRLMGQTNNKNFKKMEDEQKENYVNGIADIRPMAKVKYKDGKLSDEIVTEKGHKEFKNSSLNSLRNYFKSQLDWAVDHVEQLIKERQKVKEIAKTKKISKAYKARHKDEEEDDDLNY